MDSEIKRGKFIVLEGIDGVGKSTQVNQLFKSISSIGEKVRTAREPSDGHIGRLIRTEYLSGLSKTDGWLIQMLIAADRYDNYLVAENNLDSKLNQGYNIIDDRCVLSSMAYYCSSLTTNEDPMKNSNSLINATKAMFDIYQLNEHAMSIIKPDLIIYIDLPVDECVNRINESRSSTDIFEDKTTLMTVKQFYRMAIEILKNEGYNIEVVNGSGTTNEVHARIWHVVNSLLKK